MSTPHRKKGLFISLFILLTAVCPAISQTAREVFSGSGIWQDYGPALSVKDYPEFKGRLVNIKWADIETAPDNWDWTHFDEDVNDHIIDDLPIILMVYTGMNAPEWIYSNGVPKVIETASDGSTDTYSPYYLDEDYNVYFKRMVTNVKKHIQSLPSGVRDKVIGVQACFGSTGDQIDYKGEVPERYAITKEQFDSLFKVYSTYYYNEYKDESPKITLLHHPYYTDSVQLYWLLENCPGGWIKCGTFAKGSQLNFELQKNKWLYDVLNKPYNGKYVQARCEIVGTQLAAGWWTKNQYKEMFGIMCYGIYWGLDWPNQKPDFIQNAKFDSAFAFFNKYAGQKVAGTATNAICALKDVLDASDSSRFSSARYGAAERFNTQRYRNIYDDFKAYGAKLEDISVVTGSEYTNLSATGTNDVGWLLIPGNYERFLHQINANATSAGYWNIDDAHNDVMYGRFGRGFDIARNKTALYFDVQNSFLRNKPLDATYPVTIEITYFDSGEGSWQLVYDSKDNSDKLALTVTCTNTKTWIKKTVTLEDAYFDNRGTSGADFYINNAGTENVIFSTVELSRKEQSDENLVATALPAFDTVCINAVTHPKSFVINGASLDGWPILVGPLSGYKFSTSPTADYQNFLLFQNYGSSINTTIYVKQNTETAGDFSGNIPVFSGGSPRISVKAISVISNASPVLDASVSLVSCYTYKDGAINLHTNGGIGPFKYKWTNDLQRFWSDSSEDISGLQPDNYTVTVNAAFGCVTSKTFQVTEPEKLVAIVTEDSAMFCKDSTTTVTVSATGGTLPYIGTGSYVAGKGFSTYYVTDARGCTDQQNINIENGENREPKKPKINAPKEVNEGETNVSFTVEEPEESTSYSWTVPEGAQIVSGQNTATILVNWGSSAGDVTVTAFNACGQSPVATEKIKVNSKRSLTNNNFSTNSMVAPIIVATDENVTEATDKDVMVVTGKNISINTKQLMLMPNPVSSIATLSFYAEKSYAYNIRITDIKGRVLLTKNGFAVAAINQVKFDVSEFNAGIYFITLIHNNGETKTVKMMKQ